MQGILIIVLSLLLSSCVLTSSGHQLLVSFSPDRENSAGLNNYPVPAYTDIFIHLLASPEEKIVQVDFYLDLTEYSPNGPNQIERYAPYDFQGGSREKANPYLFEFPGSEHKITANVSEIVDGHKCHRVIEAKFKIVMPEEKLMQSSKPNRSKSRVMYSNLLPPIIAAYFDTFIFFTGGANQEIIKVEFYLNDESSPFHVERSAPWDFAGGSVEKANPHVFDDPGSEHTIIAKFTYRVVNSGGITRISGVNNSDGDIGTFDIDPTIVSVTNRRMDEDQAVLQTVRQSPIYTKTVRAKIHVWDIFVNLRNK